MIRRHAYLSVIAARDIGRFFLNMIPVKSPIDLPRFSESLLEAVSGGDVRSISFDSDQMG